MLALRKVHHGELINGPRVPLKSHQLKDLQYFDYNSNFRWSAKLEYPEKREVITIPTYSGKKKNFDHFANAVVRINQHAITLALFQSHYALKLGDSTHLFLPFKDASNGQETYGGGRYLDIDLNNVENDEVIIDFNQSYNPWCAYSDGFNCPIPPPGNELSFPIFAGEKNYNQK